MNDFFRLPKDGNDQDYFLSTNLDQYGVELIETRNLRTISFSSWLKFSIETSDVLTSRIFLVVRVQF